MAVVALRKESVDRKEQRGVDENSGITSLSARRAWIEKLLLVPELLPLCCRSPQGERG